MTGKATLASLKAEVAKLRATMKVGMRKAKPKTKPGKIATTVVVVIAAILVITGIITYWPKPTPQSTTGVFVISAEDSLAFKTLRSSDCPADLYSHKTGTSLNLKSNWVKSTEITLLAQVSEAVLDTTKYDQFWLNASCEDDGGSTTFDDGLTRNYSARFQQIYRGEANKIGLYQTPTATSVTLVDADDGTVLNATAGIDGTHNITCYVQNAQNQYETLCAWVRYFNPITQEYVNPTLTADFQNEVDGAGELACDGLSADAASDLKSIAYTLPSLYHVPWVGTFFWSYPNPGNNITAWAFAMA